MIYKFISLFVDCKKMSIDSLFARLNLNTICIFFLPENKKSVKTIKKIQNSFQTLKKHVNMVY